MIKLASNVEHCPTCGKKNSNFKKPKIGRIMRNLEQGYKHTRAISSEMSKSELRNMLAQAIKNTK